MDTLQQMFMTVLAAFAFVILIAKIASSATYGGADNSQISTVLKEKLKSSNTEKISSRRKSTKKVRFAVDHDEFVNKAVAEPSETKSIVFQKNLNEIEQNCGHESYETVDCDVNNAIDESVSACVDCVDQDETKLGEIVSVDENVGKYVENHMCMKLLCDDGIDEAEKEKEGLISEEDDSSDDDWEGVERSDLEKLFVMAADYGKLDDKLQSLGSDVQMQLYALHKVATEGPCHEAQPMALKVSARAKWNSWQKLGNMNPDMAMEQYIALLSALVPGWAQGIHSVDKR